ncbi:hypothetical protein LEMLEM_LOCUS12629 [Lemmus lemmus]
MRYEVSPHCGDSEDARRALHSRTRLCPCEVDVGSALLTLCLIWADSPCSFTHGRSCESLM